MHTFRLGDLVKVVALSLPTPRGAEQEPAHGRTGNGRHGRQAGARISERGASAGAIALVPAESMCQWHCHWQSSRERVPCEPAPPQQRMPGCKASSSPACARHFAGMPRISLHASWCATQALQDLITSVCAGSRCQQERPCCGAAPVQQRWQRGASRQSQRIQARRFTKSRACVAMCSSSRRSDTANEPAVAVATGQREPHEAGLSAPGAAGAASAGDAIAAGPAPAGVVALQKSLPLADAGAAPRMVPGDNAAGAAAYAAQGGAAVDASADVVGAAKAAADKVAWAEPLTWRAWRNDARAASGRSDTPDHASHAGHMRKCCRRACACNAHGQAAAPEATRGAAWPASGSRCQQRCTGGSGGRRSRCAADHAPWVPTGNGLA
jgi:hypothetical protein